MTKVKYPDDIVRARREAIEVAENLEVWADGDEFVIELFKDEHSTYERLIDALDEAASLILGDCPVDSVEFFQTDGVWSANMASLRIELRDRKKHG
jgi:hypothetical protein|nr:MAG TPA: hypothetical protein [Caudoviricetes sp.]